MVTLGTPDRGTCFQVFQIIGVLQVPTHTCMYLGGWWEGDMCFNGPSMGHPLKREGT